MEKFVVGCEAPQASPFSHTPSVPVPGPDGGVFAVLVLRIHFRFNIIFNGCFDLTRVISLPKSASSAPDSWRTEARSGGRTFENRSDGAFSYLGVKYELLLPAAFATVHGEVRFYTFFEEMRTKGSLVRRGRTCFSKLTRCGNGRLQSAFPFSLSNTPPATVLSECVLKRWKIQGILGRSTEVAGGRKNV